MRKMDTTKAKTGLKEMAIGTLLLLPCTVPIGLLLGVTIGVAWRVATFVITF